VEIWKSLEEFNGFYEVSNYGQVKRVKAGPATRIGRLIKMEVDRDGYYIANICIYNKRYKKKLHRLVAKAFLKNPLNLPEVNHKNGDKSDNSESNLEWSTNKDNVKHACDNGLRALGENAPGAKLKEKDVLYIRKEYSPGKAKELALIFGVSKTQIFRIMRRKCWKELEQNETS
jgi:hypothetical protein